MVDAVVSTLTLFEENALPKLTAAFVARSVAFVVSSTAFSALSAGLYKKLSVNNISVVSVISV